jgi:hypothetical protein
MPDGSETRSSDLAERLRLWIVLGGYILGGWAIIQFALSLIAWGPPFQRFFRIEILTPIHWLSSAMLLVSPLLLLAGCWGFQRHRRWARPVLFTYAGMWVAGLLGVKIAQFVNMLDGAYGDMSSTALFSSALGTLDLAVYASVFPIFVVLCLTHPAVRDQFPEFRAGFAPIVGVDKGS